MQHEIIFSLETFKIDKLRFLCLLDSEAKLFQYGLNIAFDEKLLRKHKNR